MLTLLENLSSLGKYSVMSANELRSPVDQVSTEYCNRLRGALEQIHQYAEEEGVKKGKINLKMCTA
jgi:hypothetical protein